MRNADALDDLDGWGDAPAEWRDALEAEEVDFEVDADNWETVTMFTRVQTQWRYGFAGPTGLDYSGVESCLRMADVTNTPALFGGLQIMEVAALREMAAQRGK